MYVIDGRTPTPQGDVPSHDIIGAFQVDAGIFGAGSYLANPQHFILSEDGFLRLRPALREKLLAELGAHKS